MATISDRNLTPVLKIAIFKIIWFTNDMKDEKSATLNTFDLDAIPNMQHMIDS